MASSKKNICDVVSVVLSHYKKHRRSFPWRETRDPYFILVSEYMLQQTQTDRVVPKFVSFTKKFPTVYSLARASRRSVLSQWSGLGYNRRGVALHSAAQCIVSDHDGVVPKEKELLLTLPGVGDYTASAIMTFAFNEPTVVVETNIRTVVLHHCVRGSRSVGDDVVSRFVDRLLHHALSEKISPRVFYSALMDYGAHLKREGVRVNSRSSHYTKQSTFAGSVRQARGATLRLLVASRGGVSRAQLQSLSLQKTQEALAGLVADGIVEKRGRRYHLVE